MYNLTITISGRTKTDVLADLNEVVVALRRGVVSCTEPEDSGTVLRFNLAVEESGGINEPPPPKKRA